MLGIIEWLEVRILCCYCFCYGSFAEAFRSVSGLGLVRENRVKLEGARPRSQSEGHFYITDALGRALRSGAFLYSLAGWRK